MRRPPAELGLIAFFVVALVVATFALSRQKVGEEVETRPHRTIQNAHPGGWKAFHTLLQRQKLPVGTVELPPSEWPESASVIITGPVFFQWGSSSLWTEKEAKAALAWVSRGGTLIQFSDEWSDIDSQLGFKEPKKDTSGSSGSTDKEADPQDSPSPKPTKRDVADDFLVAELSQPVTWLPGVHHIGAADISAWDTLPNDAISLVRYPGAEYSHVVSLHPHGKGKVVLVGSGSVIDNENLDRYDNARFAYFLVRRMAEGRRGDVLFDEFHQGHSAEGKSLWDLVGVGFRRAGVHLLLVTLLGVWAAAKRLGLPVPLPPRTRTSAEYVASVADLYRRARRRDAALETLFEQFRRDLCRTAGVGAEVLDTALAKRVAQVQGLPQQEQALKDLLSLCRQKLSVSTKEFTEKDLLTLAQALERARKELGIVRRNG